MKRIAELSIIVLLPSSFAHAIQTIDKNLYLKTQTSTRLYVVEQTSAISKPILMNPVTLPEDSIVAIPVSVASTFLSHADIAKTWVCGFRIVDVMDDDIRESEDADRSDFCVPSRSFKKMLALETNSELNKKAFSVYQKTGDITQMQEIADAIEQYEKEHPYDIDNIATEKITSPLLNCSTGCLEVTSEFGSRFHPVLKKQRMHKGIDLRASIGTPVVSVYAGTVLATRTEVDRRTGKMKGFGHYVIVVHPDQKLETLYAHLSKFKTTAGKDVSRGEVIALSGNTGIGTAPHLHFETHVLRDGKSKAVNPRGYINVLLTGEKLKI